MFKSLLNKTSARENKMKHLSLLHPHNYVKLVYDKHVIMIDGCTNIYMNLFIYQFMYICLKFGKTFYIHNLCTSWEVTLALRAVFSASIFNISSFDSADDPFAVLGRDILCEIYLFVTLSNE